MKCNNVKPGKENNKTKNCAVGAKLASRRKESFVTGWRPFEEQCCQVSPPDIAIFCKKYPGAKLIKVSLRIELKNFIQVNNLSF